MKISKKGECRSCCPVAHALDILGDRWTLLIIRDMLFMGKHEYHEFMAGSEGIATNILSDRLKGLVCMDIIKSCAHPAHKTKKLYYLTQKGKDLLPVVVELIVWSGTHFPAPDFPRERFNLIKNNPKQVMKDALKSLENWEKANLNS
jgi:DNA-binding HxlR family transcriptional regulator